MSKQFEAMKKIGTFGNYVRVTDANRHLLDNGKMVVVTVKPVEGKGLVEIDNRLTDLVGSKDVSMMVGEILEIDKKRKTLLGAVLKEHGGEEALTSAGIELEEQTIHNTPAGNAKSNRTKQQDKAAEARRAKARARTERLEETKKAEAQADGQTYSEIANVNSYDPDNNTENQTDETSDQDNDEDI